MRNPFVAAGYLRWWIASVVAGTGVGIQSVTVPLFIRDRVDFDERGLMIASALVAQTLPAAFLALLGGTIADRVPRHRILLRTYGVATLVSTVYVALCGFDVREIWPVYGLAALVGSAGAFTNPARQSMLPQLLQPGQIQNGVIFGTMGFMASLQFLGPSVGGLVTDASGLAAAFSVEVVLLALGALLFFGVRTPLPEASGGDIRRDLLDGLRYVAGEPALWGLLVMGPVIGVLFIGPFAVTVPLMVPDVFGETDKWVGLLWGCFGVGVFAGSVTLTLVTLHHRGLASCLSILSGGVVLTLYGWSENLAVSAVLLVVWGLGASVFMNYVVVLLQENAEPRMMGRVMSMYSLVFFASMPLGYGQAGLVTDAFGPQATLVTSGLLASCIGVACVTGLRAVRTLR
ncbi:MAG: MFS transporter [Myxococcota bacterium]